MFRTRSLMVGVMLLLVGGMGFPLRGGAQDTVPAGTVISSQNYDRIKSRSFEGHSIESMLSDSMEWMIREQKLRIVLRSSTDVNPDTRYLRATRRYSKDVEKDVEYDPSTHRVRGYKAGAPFPNVRPDSPQAGWKAYYNAYFGGAIHPVQNYYNWLINVEFDKGLDRVSASTFQRYQLLGWPFGEPYRGSGERSVHYKWSHMGMYPQSSKGVGSLSIRYLDGSMDDRWAYVRSTRKVRRLSGGDWDDPMKGTDFMYTDAFGNLPFPTWYRDWELLGVRTMLMSLSNPGDIVDPSASRPDEKFRNVDLSQPPYWSPDPRTVRFEPREVYVIKGTPQSDHPYGHSIYYVDTELNLYYQRENFDEAGNFWHFCMYPYNAATGKSVGYRAWYTVGDFCVDFRRGTASLVSVDPKSVEFNAPGASPEQFSLENLRQGKSPLPPPDGYE